MEPTNNSNKKLGIGIGVAALVVVGTIAVFGAHKPADTTPIVTPSTDSTSSPQVTSGQAVTSTTPATPTKTTTATYKDGTYTASGTYQSPGGQDQVDVSLTIKNDIVTDANVTASGDNTSKFYQGMFLANYKPLVVGKDISTLKLSKVSGSSLTSAGFNAAVQKIEVEAKA
jgi:uncharacterized protein with FMN-binding domain